MFYAHTSGNDQKDSNLSEFAYPVAMLHDIGK
jgi:hypothetical protein